MGAKSRGGGASSERSNEPRELDWSKTFKTAKDEASTSPAERNQKKDSGVHFTPQTIRKLFAASLLVIFGLTFGFLQGVFVKDGIYLLMYDRPLTLLGIILAGFITFIAPKQHGTAFGANVAHHYALVLVVLGVAILFQVQVGEIGLLIAEIVVLAGFNLFDASSMVLGIDSSLKDSSRAVNVVAGGRPMVYIGLFLGMLLGHWLAASNLPVSSTSTLACGIAIVALTTTTLIPYYSYSAASLKSETSEKANENRILKNGGELIVPPLSSATLSLDERLSSKKSNMSHWKTTCSEIAKLYQLSPRETEVFMLLAKGRNVAFIQEDLVISPHTAKTHIANVYRKLEVHSSQELLDLVESFREAERHLSEGGDEE